MRIAPWQEAIDKQIQGLAGLQMLMDRSTRRFMMQEQWQIEREIVRNAKPYDWGDEPIDACLLACRSIPLDTVFNMWNTGCSGSSWWYLSKPLPIQTTSGPEPVKALSFGWIAKMPKRYIKAGAELQEIENAILDQQSIERRLCISCWLEVKDLGFMPSQLFYWKDGETLGEMLERSRIEYAQTYGSKKGDGIGVDTFVTVAEEIGRFILGGHAWLRQRVLVETPEKIERHRRKDYVKRTGQKEEPRVQVVSLRRAEVKKSEVDGGDEKKTHREYSCRFMVGLEEGGFWRNQVCGPKRGDRRLTFIAPFMKGPEDAPLRLPKKKIFIVNR